MQSRPFADGSLPREGKLPEDNFLQTRPFAPLKKQSFNKEETPYTEEQLEKAQEFGYKAALIPAFSPPTSPPIQPKFSVDEQLNQDEEEEAEVSTPDVVEKINTPETIDSVQRATGEDAQSERNDSIELPELPKNKVKSESIPVEIADIGKLTGGKIQRKSSKKKTELPPDTIIPLQRKQIDFYPEEFSIFSNKERNQNFSNGRGEQNFFQPQKISEIPPEIYRISNKEQLFNTAQAKESHQPTVQRQPQGEQAEMTPAQREDEAARLNNLGVAQGRQGNYQEALQYFEEAIKLNPKISLLWYNKGVVSIKLERYQEAIDTNDTALVLNNAWLTVKPSWAWHNRGIALEQLGRYNQAIQSYQQALKIDPTDTNTQYNLRNLENFIAENPSLRNQTEQAPEADGGNNPFKILFGALQGAFKEDQTLPEATVGLVINLIPVLGQFADARDLAAYTYRIIFKKQYNDPLNWVGLTLTLVGLVPVVGDIAKFLGKTGGAGISKYLDDIVKLIRSVNPDLEDITKLRNAFATNWESGVKAGKDKWKTALNELSGWLDNIPDFLFAKEQEQLAKVIGEVRSQSDGMLSRAFSGIKSKIDEALDEIGRLLNPQGELVTPEGVRVPSNEIDQGPMRIEGGRNGRNFIPSQAFSELNEYTKEAIRNWNLPNSEVEKISNLLQSAKDVGDNEVARLVEQTIQRSPEAAQSNVMQLVDTLWRRQQSIPANGFSIDSQPFRSGGQNAVFQMRENRNLLVKKPLEGRGNFKNEYRALLRMEIMGIETALVKMAELNGETVLILEKIPGEISKKILDISEGQQYRHLITQRTIDDLERIYRTLQQKEVHIRDFQFMVREGDGAVIMVDPLNLLTDTPPNEEIGRILEKFREFFNQRQGGGR